MRRYVCLALAVLISFGLLAAAMDVAETGLAAVKDNGTAQTKPSPLAVLEGLSP